SIEARVALCCFFRGGSPMKPIRRMTLLFLCSFACLFALVSFSAAGASGQAVTATLSGRIMDASGGSIVKASVAVVNAATGLSRSVQTSDNGEYSIPALPAGDYGVTVSFSGFAKQ